MQLIRLYRVLVIGGTALTAGCSGSEAASSRQELLEDAALAEREDAGSEVDAAPDDAALDSVAIDAAKDGIDSWLSWS